MFVYVCVVTCETRAENRAINSAISKHKTHVRNPILDVNTTHIWNKWIRACLCVVYAFYSIKIMCVHVHVHRCILANDMETVSCVYTFWNLNVFIYCHYVCTYWMISLITKHCNERQLTDWVSVLKSVWLLIRSIVHLFWDFTFYLISHCILC